jgi:hypothetical protein
VPAPNTEQHMSRPTNRDKGYLESTYHAYGPNGVIDFVPPNLGSAYCEPSIYAQAGFPGYQQPLGYQYPQHPGAYPLSAAYPHSAYPLSAPAPYPASFPLAAPTCQEEPTRDLHERINAKIDSIISSHRASAQDQKADILGTQIERLTRKVQRLSASVEGKHGMGSLEAEDDSEEDKEGRVESRVRDNEIASRLRRLAVESKMRERSERLEERGRRNIPDW